MQGRDITLLIAGGQLSAYHANIKLAQLCPKELQLICLHTCSVYISKTRFVGQLII